MCNQSVRALMGMFFVSASHATASFELGGPLSETLFNNNQVIQVMNSGNPEAVRERLMFDSRGLLVDTKSGQLKSLDNSKGNLSGDEEKVFELNKIDSESGSLDNSVNQDSRSFGVLAANGSVKGQVNKRVSSSTLRTSDQGAPSAASVLGGASVITSSLPLGSNSKAFSTAEGFSNADRWASLTSKQIAGVNNGPFSGEASINNKKEIYGSSGSSQVILGNSQPLLSPNASQSDVAALSEVFSGYDSLEQPSAEASVVSFQPNSTSVSSNNNGIVTEGSSANGSAPHLSTAKGSIPANSNDRGNGTENNNVNSSKGIPAKEIVEKPANCQVAKENFYSNFNNTSSYTNEEIVTDNDGKSRKQYCIKPKKDDLYDVYAALGSLEASCSQEIGALFYGSDAESACVWVDDPSSSSGSKGHNLDDLFSKSSAESTLGKAEVGPKVNHRNVTSGVSK
jgi:hypothetical protein